MRTTALLFSGLFSHFLLAGDGHADTGSWVYEHGAQRAMVRVEDGYIAWMCRTPETPAFFRIFSRKLNNVEPVSIIFDGTVFDVTNSTDKGEHSGYVDVFEYSAKFVDLFRKSSVMRVDDKSIHIDVPLKNSAKAFDTFVAKSRCTLPLAQVTAASSPTPGKFGTTESVVAAYEKHMKKVNPDPNDIFATCYRAHVDILRRKTEAIIAEKTLRTWSGNKAKLNRLVMMKIVDADGDRNVDRLEIYIDFKNDKGGMTYTGIHNNAPCTHAFLSETIGEFGWSCPVGTSANCFIYTGDFFTPPKAARFNANGYSVTAAVMNTRVRMFCDPSNKRKCYEGIVPEQARITIDDN